MYVTRVETHITHSDQLHDAQPTRHAHKTAMHVRGPPGARCVRVTVSVYSKMLKSLRGVGSLLKQENTSHTSIDHSTRDRLKSDAAGQL